jgi:hypothetical protein
MAAVLKQRPSSQCDFRQSGLRAVRDRSTRDAPALASPWGAIFVTLASLRWQAPPFNMAPRGFCGVPSEFGPGGLVVRWWSGPTLEGPLVRSDDWKPILRRVRRDPDSPAFTILEARQTFLEEALFHPTPGRDRTLLEKWRVPLHDLLAFAVAHELGHALCQVRDEVLTSK